MNTGQYITDGNVTWIVTDIRDGNTVGDIAYKPYLADGYVKANGATVLRADYPRLVALADQYSLWTSSPSDYPGLFGEGDGSTTMVLPDLRDRVLWGSASGAGTGVEAGLPNITGEHISSVPMGLWHGADGTWCGALVRGSITTVTAPLSTSENHADPAQYRSFGIDASKSNSIYGNSSTVQPPAVKMIVQIKY